MYVRLPQAMEPGSHQVSKKTDDRLSASPLDALRFHCSVAATALLTNGDFAAGNRLILMVIGWQQKDASGEGFADCWQQITIHAGFEDVSRGSHVQTSEHDFWVRMYC
jgi:hypothetical protein